MTAIAKLRGPVDAFFDKVTVNADDPSFRENRLKLLNRIRAATLAVADFSKIEGLDVCWALILIMPALDAGIFFQRMGDGRVEHGHDENASSPQRDG